jgi:hypothetical protein
MHTRMCTNNLYPPAHFSIRFSTLVKLGRKVMTVMVILEHCWYCSLQDPEILHNGKSLKNMWYLFWNSLHKMKNTMVNTKNAKLNYHWNASCLSCCDLLASSYGIASTSKSYLSVHSTKRCNFQAMALILVKLYIVTSKSHRTEVLTAVEWYRWLQRNSGF